jgi:tripartite-type tricarboxylate transporter receptor subunit TctC
VAGTAGSHLVNPLVSRKPAYDPVKDFVPVTMVSLAPFSVTVYPGVPARTLQELVALIKASPGKFSYASAGAGTMSHLAGEMFRMQAGNLDLQHVPYKGLGPAIQDMIAGHIQMGMALLTSSLQAHHRSGKLRVLAVCYQSRVPAVPDIPTAAESGLPDLMVGAFNGIFAPAGTPAEVVDVLHHAPQRAFHEGALRKDLERAGAEALVQSTPQWSVDYLANEIRRWTPVVRAAGIQTD